MIFGCRQMNGSLNDLHIRRGQDNITLDIVQIRFYGILQKRSVGKT